MDSTLSNPFLSLETPAPAALEQSEGARSAAERSGSAAGAVAPVPQPDEHPDSQAPVKATRRRFSAADKRAFIRQADACKNPGERGALLRRAGLYSSHLTLWRRQLEKRELAALAPVRRGRKPKAVNPLAGEVKRLTRKLAQAERIIAFQKKVAALLEIPLSDLPGENGEEP